MKSAASYQPASPRVIGYIRVSTEDQAREGVSIQAQEDRIRGYCKAHGLCEPTIIRDEGVSGTVPPDKRPGMCEALRQLDAGEASALVAVRLDRWSRTALDMLTIADRAHRHGWALHSVSDHLDTSNPVGRFTLTILAGVAQLERDMIASRTSDALQAKIRRGAILGGAPYGWRKVAGADGKLTALEPDPDEQAIVSHVRRLARHLTQDGVAVELERVRYPTRDGKPWTRRRVQAALASPVVAPAEVA